MQFWWFLTRVKQLKSGAVIFIDELVTDETKHINWLMEYIYQKDVNARTKGPFSIHDVVKLYYVFHEYASEQKGISNLSWNFNWLN